MPQSLSTGVFALGGVLLLVAILGGNFKIFGAEVHDQISSWQIRLISGLIGIVLVVVALASSLGIQAPATSTSAVQASGSTASTLPRENPVRVEPETVPSRPEQTNPPAPPVSRFGVGIVFDPPSNVRASPDGSSDIVCAILQKSTIKILGSAGNGWYKTDVCSGTIGYIHRSQVRFSE
jgi:hypothetical protein